MGSLLVKRVARLMMTLALLVDEAKMEHPRLEEWSGTAPRRHGPRRRAGSQDQSLRAYGVGDRK